MRRRADYCRLIKLVPDHPRFAPDWVRAFEEDPQLAVDWGMSDEMTEAFARDSLAGHAELWEKGEGRHFAVVSDDESEFLGGINFHNIREDHNRAEVGFWLAPWARGRGIGTDALREACTWGFERWDLVRIEMTTLPDNDAALALARKLGFEREGLLRQRNFERGKQVDIVMLSLLRSTGPTSG